MNQKSSGNQILNSVSQVLTSDNAMIGWTALHLAALLGTPESIMALLSAGADATLTNDDGETPFDLAQYNENVRDTAAYWALNWSLSEPEYN